MKLLLGFSFLLISSLLFSQDDFDLARKHFGENNIDSARYYINKSLRRNPQPDDYFLSGLIHESENKNLRALADYEAVVKVQPSNLEAYFQKGLIYYNSASAEQAIEDFTYVIENHERSNTNAIYFGNDPFGKKGTFITSLQSMVGSVYQYRGMAHQKLGNDEKALEDFNKSFEFDTLADFYVNRSQLYSKTDRTSLAIEDLKKAIEIEPQSYLAWYNLAILDETVMLPSYLLEDEEFSPMLNLLGANAYESGQYAMATQYLTKAIENNPDEELAYLNRGKSLLKTQAYKQARSDFLKALQLNNSNAEVFFLIGNSFFYEENFEDAIGFYERYLSVDQGYKNVWYNAAMAYLSTEKTDRACECLRSSDKLGMEQAADQIKKYCETQ
ncbi:MAG: tetratricopeptide repeat protein [Cyclobacteriaceae bacterium]